MKKTLLATIIASIGFGMGTAHADAINDQADLSYAWSNVYTDVVNEGFVTSNPFEKPFTGVLGFEGGYDYGKLSMYGFFEHNYTLNEEFAKLTAHYTVANNISIYGQTTYLSGEGFGDETGLVGIGYTGLNGDNYSVRPYVGYQVSSVDAENSVPVVGFSGFYALGGGTSIAGWGESMMNKEEDLTLNGSIGVYQDVTQRVYVGAMYNFKHNTAGAVGYDDQIVFRVGLHI